MERDRLLRNWLFSICFIACTLFVASCGDRPVPGPISPSDQAGTPSLSERGKSRAHNGKVRPVTRKSRNANVLAKGTFHDKAVQHTQDLIYELQYIVDTNPGTAVADKVEDVVAKARTAIIELKKSPPDYPAAFGNLEGAMGDLQAAIKDRLLDDKPGAQLKNEIVAIKNVIQSGGGATHDCRGTSKLLLMKRSKGGLIAHCGHQIIVPKYALPQDAEMSITVDNNDYITVDFGPDRWFNKPVTVVISYKDADLSGIDESSLTMAWYDETKGEWIAVDCTVDSIKKIVRAKVPHFTQYTLSKR
jgi:hypothetical protein